MRLMMEIWNNITAADIVTSILVFAGMIWVTTLTNKIADAIHLVAEAIENKKS